MADVEPTQTDAQDGGAEPVTTSTVTEPAQQSGAEPTEPTDDGKTFTQADIDRAVKDRLTREKAKFADYDDLKATAAKWQEHEDDQKSELEKLQDQITAAEAERDVAQQEAVSTMIQSAFVTAASKFGAAHPEDAYRLADLSLVDMKDGKIAGGVEDQVETLVKDGRLPKSGSSQVPNVDGGSGQLQRGQEPSMTEAEIREEAILFGVSPHFYAEAQGVKLSDK